VAVEPAAPTCAGVSVSTGFRDPVEVSLECAGGSLTYETVSAPHGGELSGLDPQTGALVYTPEEGFSGADSFTYRAVNPRGKSPPATVTLTVAPPPPSCRHVPVSTGAAVPVSARLDCAGSGALTYSTVSKPAHGSLTQFSPATGAFTYVPLPGFSGADSFAYRAANSGGPSDVATVTIAVAALSPPAPPPTVSNSFRLAKVKRDPRRGTATVAVWVPGPGTVRLAKTAKVAPARERAGSAGVVTLTVKPRGKAARLLRELGRVEVVAEVVYLPDGGVAATADRKLTLRAKPH